jgi:CBS domain-containing protein
MRKGVDTIEEAASIQETAMKMRDKNVSSLLVVDKDGKPIGLVTERDLVRKVCVNDIHIREVTNKEIMSFPLVTIDSTSSPSEAANTMLSRNVRHLIVVNGKSTDISKPVGMMTPRDFTKFQEYTREEIRSIEKILDYYL